MSSATSSRRPNILLISSDSMDGRIMGCAGHPAANTPNFDRLASEGVLFQNAYCNSPQCCPSRASMWSGKHVFSCEAWNNYKGLEPGDPTFQTCLDDAGYDTHIIGRTDHLSGRHSWNVRLNAWLREANVAGQQKAGPKQRFGVEETDEVRFSETDWVRVEETVEWLRARAKSPGDPFFLSVGFLQPHPSFVTTPYWLDRIDPNKVTLPPVDEASHPVLEFMKIAKGCTDELTDEETLLIRRIYYAMVAEVDAMVGEIVEALQDTGLGDSTWVINISDHGEMNLEHGQYLKNSLYESSVRVPLIVNGPDAQAGCVIEHPVSLVDIFPTLMDMAGASKPDWLEGRSLMPELTGAPSRHPDWVLSEYHSNFQNTGSFMLRSGKWKYIVYVGYEPQLFDVEEDPEEVRNLAPVMAEIVRKLDEKLRGIVDYEEVDARAKAYDRRNFVAWRAAASDEEYNEKMRQAIRGYGDDDEAKVRTWLAKG